MKTEKLSYRDSYGLEEGMPYSSSYSIYIHNTLYKVLLLLSVMFWPYYVLLPPILSFVSKITWVVAIYGVGILVWDLFHERAYFSSKLSHYYLLLIAFCALSLIMNYDHLYKTAKGYMHLFLGLFLLAQFPMGMANDLKNKQIRIIFFIIEVWMFLLSIVALFVFFYGIAYQPAESETPWLSFGFRGNRLDILIGPNVLGTYMSILICCVIVNISLTLEGATKKRCITLYLLHGIALAFSSVVLSLTQSRGATYFLAIVLSCICFALYKFVPRKRWYKCMLFIILSSIVFFGSIFGEGLLYKQIAPTYGFLHNNNNPSNEASGPSGLMVGEARVFEEPVDETLSGRTVIWHQAVNLISLRPIGGIGDVSYPNSLIENLPYDKGLVERYIYGNVHNSLLQIILQIGLVFGLSVLIGMFYLLVHCFRAFFTKWKAIPFSNFVFFAIFIAYCCWSLIDSFALSYDLTWCIFMTLCGILSDNCFLGYDKQKVSQ